MGANSLTCVLCQTSERCSDRKPIRQPEKGAESGFALLFTRNPRVTYQRFLVVPSGDVAVLRNEANF